ncbi:ComEA family DNA-binding protein [uncultured Tessaracoccus sp.]|uniref:ComEA family DNA-binding protein n=1 Tax=uncultured Tessaracoccus sp. TaxID=905023 RepID=UPI0025E9A4CF|nr:ComEA family DNA-binding protein [uncultured Tessaracoccus sp.]
MSKTSLKSADELARARLAYLSIGQPPLAAPRRAVVEPPEEPPAPGAVEAAPTPAPDPPPAPPGERPLARWRDRLALSRTHVVALVLVVAVLAVTIALSLGGSAPTTVSAQPPPPVESSPPPAKPAASPSPTAPERLRVHVVGAVARPGVVQLPAGSIVDDAIRAAGGLTDAAAPGDLNLAAPVADGMQVKVGSGSESSHVDAPAAPSGGGTAGGAASAGGDQGGDRLDLNAATQEQLEALPGVGPVTAQAILAWREEHGGFTDVAELQEVSGIGPKTFAKLEPHVRV